LQHGGWDLVHHTLADALVDFSTRLAAAGQPVVWTPHVTLHPLQPLLPTPHAWEPEHAAHALAAASRQRLLGAHLGALAQDTHIHPDLLLQTPQALSHQRPLTWNTRANERPRVLVLDAPSDANAPLMAWLDKLRDSAAAVVLKVDRNATAPLDVLTLARLAPHVIVLNASPAADVQALMREVKARLPHICLAVHVDTLECLSDAEQRSAGYRQRVLEACTQNADRLFTFEPAPTDPAPASTGLRAVEGLHADSPLPPEWWGQTSAGSAPIAQ